MRTAESKYFAGHNAYGTRAQLDSASLIAPPPVNQVLVTATGTGYTVTARNAEDPAAPATCTLQVEGGESAAAAAKPECHN